MQCKMYGIFVFLSLIFAVSVPAVQAGKTSFIESVSIARAAHPGLGRDTKGFEAAVHREGILYLVRRYGLYAYTIASGGHVFIPFPDDFKGERIVSMAAHGSSVWSAGTQGRVYQYDISAERWTVHSAFSPGPLLLSSYLGRFFISEYRIGGTVYEYRDAAFVSYFTLPEHVPARPGRLYNIEGDGYLGTDMGLFKLVKHMRTDWHMMGTPQHFAKTVVHDLALYKGRIFAAATPPQYARIPANFKHTSFGSFYYMYFQQRWERYTEPIPRELQDFIRVNAANTGVPEGGVWLAGPGVDEAARIEAMDGDFFALAVHESGLLAASRKGLYYISATGAADQSFSMQQLAGLDTLSITALIIAGNRAFVSAGDTLLSFAMPPGTIIAPAIDASTPSQPGARLPAELRTEEDRFIYQIEMWLRRQQGQR